MGSSFTPSGPASTDFLEIFRAYANASSEMSFAEFMRLALYDPHVGYYRANRTRVGYGHGTDFFTATTSGPIFGALVTAACANLLHGQDLSQYSFVEIGAETAGTIIDGAHHPYRISRSIRNGEPLTLDGRCIVFSNELFDAQPFRRFVFLNGAWREVGVALRDGFLAEIVYSNDADGVPDGVLPLTAQEGYVFDAPLAAVALLDSILTQPWNGLFVACDYGKSWRELAEACPAGTARAYYRHSQSNELLARPGEQDLTCHVCWDWLSESLSKHGFAASNLMSQESFWVHHSAEYIEKISVSEAGRFSHKKQSLQQLLHPAHLGQKFQVLWGKRAALG